MENEVILPPSPVQNKPNFTGAIDDSDGV